MEGCENGDDDLRLGIYDILNRKKCTPTYDQCHVFPLKLAISQNVLCLERQATPQASALFLNALNTLPFTPQVLLPQADLVIRTADSQHITAQAPAHPPDRRLKVQHLALPLAGAGGVGRPDTHCLVLRRRGDVALLQNGGGPGYVTDPVGVAGEGLAFLLVLHGRRVESPDLENIVTSTRDEPPVSASTRARVAANDTPRRSRRRPAHTVDTKTVSMVRDVVDGVVLELEHRDVAVRGRAGEETAGLVGRPGDDVDRGFV